MKKILLLFIAFSFLSVFAQSVVIDNKTDIQELKISPEEQAKPYWGPYMQEVQQSIKSNWDTGRNKNSNIIVVRFIISKDGTLSDLHLVRSSRNSNSDNAALDAVRKTAPFKPLPQEYNGEAVPVEFVFRYSLIINSTNSSQDICKTKFCKFMQKY